MLRVVSSGVMSLGPYTIWSHSSTETLHSSSDTPTPAQLAPAGVLAVAGAGGDQWGVESGRSAAAGLHVPRLPEEPFEQGGLGLGCLFARFSASPLAGIEITRSQEAAHDDAEAGGGVGGSRSVASAALPAQLLALLCSDAAALPARVSAARMLQTAAADVETCRELVASGGVAALLMLLRHTLLYHTPPAAAGAAGAAVAGAGAAAAKGAQPREQELKRELCELLTQMLQTSRTETLASCRPCEAASAVAIAMKQWPEDEALQLAACATLAQLATDERGGACVIVEHNGLALLFDALIRLAL
jgi:hypothetical protein